MDEGQQLAQDEPGGGAQNTLYGKHSKEIAPRIYQLVCLLWESQSLLPCVRFLGSIGG